MLIWRRQLRVAIFLATLYPVTVLSMHANSNSSPVSCGSCVLVVFQVWPDETDSETESETRARKTCTVVLIVESTKYYYCV